MIAAILISPLIFGFFLIFGAFLLDPEEHPVIRIFMLLLSFLTFFMSSWLAWLAVHQYYTFTALEEAIVTGLWIFGTMTTVIIIYFVIYAFYKASHAAAQKKDEMMLQ